MAQEVKAFAVQGWRPQFNSYKPCKSEKRGPVPQSCPLNSTCMHTQLLFFYYFLNYFIILNFLKLIFYYFKRNESALGKTDASPCVGLGC